MNKVYERWWTIFGHEIHLRIEPPDFRADIARLSRLIDDGKIIEIRQAVEAAYTKWGCDAEIVRLSTFADFLYEEME